MPEKLQLCLCGGDCAKFPHHYNSVMSTPDPTTKPKRKRKTRAEREAEQQAEFAAQMAKPIDPIIWIILGGLILFFAGFTYLDPVTLAEAGQPKDWSPLQLVPLFLISLFGKTATVCGMTALGGISLAAGVYGWLRKRLTPGD
jgi:hypothetical protein